MTLKAVATKGRGAPHQAAHASADLQRARELHAAPGRQPGGGEGRDGKHTRVLRIKLTSALLKRIQKAKTPFVSVKVRIVGIDGNKNVTRKTITLRIRR